MPAEVVLVIDACHSGHGRQQHDARDWIPEELARRIQAIHERGLYVINAARSEELSWEHGRLAPRRAHHRTARRHCATDDSPAGPQRSVSMLGLGRRRAGTRAAHQHARLGIQVPQTPGVPALRRPAAADDLPVAPAARQAQAVDCAARASIG
ncbi:MAG: hypothetical protein MZW92_12835 [Comamonadaceae bacterium]|nr:hypothetical protein [Comamonadaceae bacterium]